MSGAGEKPPPQLTRVARTGELGNGDWLGLEAGLDVRAADAVGPVVPPQASMSRSVNATAVASLTGLSTNTAQGSYDLQNPLVQRRPDLVVDDLEVVRAKDKAGIYSKPALGKL